MRICGTNDPHLERVDAHTRFHFKACLQGLAYIVTAPRGIFRRILLDIVRIGFEVGESVCGGQGGVRLGIAFDLRDLGNGFPFHAKTGAVGGEGFTAQIGFRKHIAFGNIGIMRDGDKLCARPLGCLVKPGPQVFRVGTVCGGEGLKLPPDLRIVGREHNPVQVGTRRDR